MTTRINDWKQRALALFAGLILCSGSPSRADSAKTGGVLFREPFGARPFAMGHAYAALGDDVFGLSYNPAILSRMRRSQVATQFTKSVLDTQLGFLGAASPLSPNNALGLSLAYLDAGALQVFDQNGQETASVNAQRDLLLQLGYAHSMQPYFGRLHLGLSTKALRSVLGQQAETTAYAADLGGLYERPWKGGLASVALAVSNIGPGIRYTGGLATGASDPLPLTARAAASYARDVFKTDHLILTTELDRVFHDQVLLKSFGLEYDYHRLFAVRAGCRQGGPSVQVFVGIGFSARDLAIDYGMGLAQSSLGNTQKISLSYRFTIPGIRYGPPYLGTASLTETMAERIEEHILQDRYFEARAEIERLREIAPEAKEVMQLTARVHEKMENILSRGSQDPRYSYASGFQDYLKGHWEDAVSRLQQSLRLEPENGEIVKYLRKSQKHLEEIQEKKKLEQQARIGTLFELANQAYEGGDSSRALHVLEEILYLGPYQPAASLRRKILAASRPAERTKLRPMPTPSPSVSTAGGIQPSAAETEKADQLYNQAVRQYLMNEPLKALASLREAVRLNPGNESIRNLLISIKKEHREKEGLGPP